MRVLALVLTAGVLAVVGCGGEDDDRAVRLYCQYGAETRAQLDGCVDHVSIDDVRGYDTNAAHYALNSLAECRSDAGPFCEDEPYAPDPRGE